MPITAGNAPAKVGRRAAAGQADDREVPAGPQQVRHLRQSCPGVHVVQRGDRGDQVQRTRLERRGQEIRQHVSDARRAGMGTRQLDAPPVAVNAGHLRHNPPQPPGQRARPAANVQGTLAAIRDRSQDQPVIVHIMTPRHRPAIWPRPRRNPASHDSEPALLPLTCTLTWPADAGGP